MRYLRRLLPCLTVIAACAGRASTPSIPSIRPTHEAPATDLAYAVDGATVVDPNRAGNEAKDPRVVDLDIIRITATTKGVGGEVTTEHVATADLFKQANGLAKTSTEGAIALYRQIITEFPDSKYAPISLFNIAAILDGRGELEATIATLRDLVKRYPNARESIDGHLYIAALQADHD